MTVIADITVPADTFALGRVLDDISDIKFERIVSLQEDNTSPVGFDSNV